ncbi:cc74d425-12ab-4220-a3fc-c0ebf1e82b1a [Thermothielavioides terrestris]|uniref:Cc74d425-12ab-4220-a3fc-c0ebf1e82b1a n=1 Tax=Thermothielavioides terrestris TaxID=2587410 RepID=A0A3S4AJ96_9PEZI|nr:cc74d425-12ab-4220-a3fc-c0ebf1e82b1a [Thermothielavioides terrestris]
MPRFSVTFGRRKSTADSLEHAAATGSSFRVLERSEVIGSKPFDGGAKLTAATHSLHKSTGSDVTVDDNIFADLKSNRGSGSSNTTTTKTDNSSHHSYASTAPSSADTGGVDEWRGAQRKPSSDIPVPPIPKSSSAGFLRSAGRTFSFGGQKKHLPSAPTIAESPPPTPPVTGVQTPAGGRPRAPTSSTSTTVTPPRVDSDFDLDLGGDFGKMLLGNDKRASVATLRNDHYNGQVPAPRSLTGARPIQPAPIQTDETAKVEPRPHSWGSQHSNDQLIASTSPSLSPTVTETASPPAPRPALPLDDEQQRPGTSPEVGSRRPLLAPPRGNSEQEDGEDEEARLLKDSLSTVTRFMNGVDAPTSASSPSVSRYRRNANGADGDDDSLFDSSRVSSAKYTSHSAVRQHSGPPSAHKVMTPAEFEQYRKDKERQDREREITMPGRRTNGEEDEDDNYEDDEDDTERARQQAKQRRKQEAHMAVYRQQMMKVTGESGSAPSSRPSLQISLSTPNLPNVAHTEGTANTSENSDEDEDIPLAILAAHGFPNKTRPPNRLSTMGSNPNLRASQQPSYQRPGSMMGDVSNARLPAFARNLPKDPFLGAGLVRNPVRESFSLGGGAPAPAQSPSPVPPGGLIGVIAHEERNRAMRRGSPHLEGPSSLPGTPPFDPVAGIPSHLMYQAQPSQPALSPGDQAQIQMTQQMQQFMQMQMQFMHMMAGQKGNPSAMAGGLAPGAGMPGLRGSEVRHSFLGNDSVLDLPYGRGETQMRTMSMVQPSSASWIQPAQPAGFAPSLRNHGGGYAPSIAPSERSNIGLPGRYRPVSHAPPPIPAGPGHLRTSSTMSGAIQQPSISVTTSGGASDEDDEEGWAAMRAKREKKKSLWRAKKSIGDDIGALIN